MNRNLATLRIQFPISRTRLQNIDQEYDQKQLDQIIQKIVDGITCKIIEFARKNNVNKLFDSMPSTSSLYVTLHECTQFSERLHENMVNKYMTQILDKLRERFPDTKIYFDSEQKHIFIDWS